MSWVPALGVALALAGTEPLPHFEALRTSLRPRVDGRLDEEPWRRAPVFSRFHQSFPDPGAPPSERTEVRVLYDDANLYVGVRCFDRQPSAISAMLGRRDDLPASDLVRVMVDPLRERRTALVFSVGAGGTLEDARITQDTELDRTWDGAWEGASALQADGWSVELRIPLRLLRFPRVEEQRWGFHVRRELARTHEVLDSVPLPRGVHGTVSRFAELRGLRQLDPVGQVTLLPYVALRTARLEVPRSRPPMLEPSADVGLDLQAGLSSDLSLALTVNPDFGQVEADRLLYNLQHVEPFFPERRPFFLDGMELFESLVVDDDLSPHTLLYSRRIGLELPLLGAARLSGRVSEGVQVAVLDAVVGGEVDPLKRAALEAGADPELVEPDTSVRFRPWRPLHLAPTYTLPAQVAAPSNFLAGVVRAQVSQALTLGGAVSLTTPLGPECHPEDAVDPGCTPRGGGAATLDAALRSDSGELALAAQLSGSRVMGGPSRGRVLVDGTLLRSGETGWGLKLNGGKLGGEPLRLEVGYIHASPRLELNDAGFQPLQNEQTLVVNPEYVALDWMGLPEVAVGLLSTTSWSTDERSLLLGSRLALVGRWVLAEQTSGDCELGVHLGRQDLREVVGTGVAFERPAQGFVGCFLATDPTRPLSLEALAFVDFTAQQGLLRATWRPRPWLNTSLSVLYESLADGPRWLESGWDGFHHFGDLTPRFVTLTLRQLVVLGPTLTLQAYAELFSGYGHYQRWYRGRAGTDRRLPLAALQPAPLSGEDPSFHTAALNLNLVLRWEYALGSTLFVVYAHSQESRPPTGEPAPITVWPVGLLDGPLTSSILVKLSYAL